MNTHDTHDTRDAAAIVNAGYVLVIDDARVVASPNDTSRDTFEVRHNGFIANAVAMIAHCVTSPANDPAHDAREVARRHAMRGLYVCDDECGCPACERDARWEDVL